MKIRNYAVAAGERLEDSWNVAEFEGGIYHLRVYGPNGFFREFIGSQADPPVDFRFDSPRNRDGGTALSGDIEIVAANRDRRQVCTIEVRDNSYKHPTQSRRLAPGERVTLTINAQKSSGWYDVSDADRHRRTIPQALRGAGRNRQMDDERPGDGSHHQLGVVAAAMQARPESQVGFLSAGMSMVIVCEPAATVCRNGVCVARL